MQKMQVIMIVCMYVPTVSMYVIIRDIFIFSLFLFYITVPPKKMPKSHPIIEHILIFL